MNLSSPGQPRKLCLPEAPRPPAPVIDDHESCIAFVANHFSMSDRSQPPERCFGGNSPFLHHRKSVERLTPTMRTTSLVLMRASIPASRSRMGRFGLPAGGIFGLVTGGTTSTSGSCTGRSSLAGFCPLEPVFRRLRLKGRCNSRGRGAVVTCPLGRAIVLGDGMDVLIA